VPAAVEGGGPLLLLPPPPHPPDAADARAHNNSAKAMFLRCLLAAMTNSNRPASRIPPLGKLRTLGIALAAVVLTVRVVLPLALIEGGLNEQLAASMVAGNWQLKVTVPVRPPPYVLVMVEVPDWPGAVMLMLAGFGDIASPGVMVTVVGAELDPV
jgi:hypothetical protein